MAGFSVQDEWLVRRFGRVEALERQINQRRLTESRQPLSAFCQAVLRKLSAQPDPAGGKPDRCQADHKRRTDR